MKGVEQLLRYVSYRRLRLRASQFLELYKDDLATVYPKQLRFTGGERVLCLAPHADDETFGAGGTLRRHLHAGDSVAVCVCSDNLDSIHSDKRRGAWTDAGSVIAHRSGEFSKAMDHIGVSDTEELLLDRSSMHEKCPVPARLKELLVENEVEVLYLPSLFDNHRDHRIVNLWTYHVLLHHNNAPAIIRGYEVWSPLPATAVADISDDFEEKVSAMRCYGSQMEEVEYIHHIGGLNAYRAMTLGGTSRYAEAFMELSVRDYLALASSVLQSHIH